MAFLDNSGDIILDAVLTDTGRFRLAKGDGSFKIVKFALADDEINYGLYNKNHPSGSAYYDLEILQSPVFEAFTNNTSTMHNKLLSIPRTDLLYLPVLRINSKDNQGQTTNINSGNDGFVVFVDRTTELSHTGSAVNGGLDGFTGGGQSPKMVRIDQGLDTTEVSYTNQLDPDLFEGQYIVEMDNRLGFVSDNNLNPTPPSFIDDDNIASYYLSLQSNGNYKYVQNIQDVNGDAISNATQAGDGLPSQLIINGPQGSTLMFRIKSSIELTTSDHLFNELGSSGTQADLTNFGTFNNGTYKFIDTIIKVSGFTTGYKIDIPVRFLKKVS